MAAEKIQKYYRRWRGRTMFQQLQHYRAAKHHDLIVFSHQVHIYGQEFFQYLSRNKAPVPLASIAAVDRETAQNTSDVRMKMLRAVKKVPISRSMNSFVDTTDMCASHRPTAGGRDGHSRTPERSVSPPQPATPPPCPSCTQRAAAAATAVTTTSTASGPSPVPRALHPEPESEPSRTPSPSPRRASLESGACSGATSPQFEFETPDCSSANVSENRAVIGPPSPDPRRASLEPGARSGATSPQFEFQSENRAALGPPSPDPRRTSLEPGARSGAASPQFEFQSENRAALGPPSPDPRRASFEPGARSGATSPQFEFQSENRAAFGPPSPDPRRTSLEPGARSGAPSPQFEFQSENRAALGPPSPDPRRASLEPGARSGAASPQFEFEMPACSSATVSETRAVFDRQAASSRPPAPSCSAPVTPAHPGHAPSYQAPATSHQTPAPSYQAPAPAPSYAAPPAPSYNRFGGSNHSNTAQRQSSAAAGGGGSKWGQRWATTPPAPAAFVQELQDRGGRPDEDDAPPFNFQGMLRKTNVARHSMKRGGPGVGTGQPANKLPTNVVISSYGEGAPTGYNAKKLRKRSTEEPAPSLKSPDSDNGGPEAALPETSGDEEPQDNGELEPTPSHNGSNGDPGRDTPYPQIVFEGEEVDL